jgi:hypothetical protein
LELNSEKPSQEEAEMTIATFVNMRDEINVICSKSGAIRPKIDVKMNDKQMSVLLNLFDLKEQTFG